MKNESMRKIVGVVLLVATAVVLTACGKSGDGSVAGTTPIDQLIQAGKPPVETGKMTRGISPVMPTFTMSVTNVSDVPVSLINGTVVFFDENGKALADTVQDAGYTDISPIAPGDQIELQIMTPNEKAITGKYILKEAVYEKTNPKFKEYGALSMKWKNPGYDADLAAEKAK
jgi:hypothetical protein